LLFVGDLNGVFVADLVDDARRDFTQRLKELAPVVEEYRRLELAAAALGQAESPARPSSSGRGQRRGRQKSAQRRPDGGSATTGKGRGSRRRSRRADEALAVVRASPGIAVAGIASELGMKPTGLYPVLSKLERNGSVRKEGRGWHPAS
jgi:hypothetical protein